MLSREHICLFGVVLSRQTGKQEDHSEASKFGKPTEQENGELHDHQHGTLFFKSERVEVLMFGYGELSVSQPRSLRQATPLAFVQLNSCLFVHRVR